MFKFEGFSSILNPDRIDRKALSNFAAPAVRHIIVPGGFLSLSSSTNHQCIQLTSISYHRHVENFRLFGIANTGNSCYLNSVLQVSSSSPLPSFPCFILN
jgi:ubiquitin C-terminal hydrolase